MPKRIYIQGMHCPACSELMQDNLSQVPGVESVQVNLLENYADLELNADFVETVFLTEANKISSKDGFQVGLTPFATNHKPNKLMDILGGIAIAAAILYLFSILSNIFGMGMQESDSIFMPLSVGFAASMSSCLALTGSVIISFTSLYRENDKTNTPQIFKINTLFQLGRIICFALGGALLAIIGTSFALTGNVLFVMYFIIAIVLLLLSLSILGITKSVFSYFKFPSISNYLKGLSVSKSPITPFIAGGLTLFLPCGFSLSMMIIAMQSTSLIQGALTMMLFALGTLPVLFAVGMTASYSQKANMRMLRNAMGLLVFAFAINTFSTAFMYFGFDEDMLSFLSPATAHAAEIAPASEHIVEMTVNANHFLPRRIVIPAGQPIVWNITGDKVSYCSNKIIVPDLKIKEPIKNGTNQIKFTAPTKPGNIKFSCWMGHITGMFVVE